MTWVLLAFLTLSAPAVVEVGRYETAAECAAEMWALPRFNDTELVCRQETLA